MTVAIPARDEARTLGALVDALLRQSRPPDEIVVCDAGSRDETTGVARALAPRVVLVDGGPAYPGRARNLAVRAATRPWVAFVDAGCVPAPDWLEKLIAARDAQPGADVVYGDYDPLVDGEWEAAQALVLLSPRDPGTGCRPPSTASMLIRRDLFLELGGFPEHLRAAEDLSFFEALERRAVLAVRAPTARVRWSVSSSPGAFLRRLRVYSGHHATAGLARTWHHRVIAMDLAAVAVLLLGLWWPLAWGALAAAFAARLLRTVLARRPSAPSEARALTPARLARAAVLLVLADAACLAGYTDFLLGRVRSDPR